MRLFVPSAMQAIHLIMAQELNYPSQPESHKGRSCWADKPEPKTLDGCATRTIQPTGSNGLQGDGRFDLPHHPTDFHWSKDSCHHGAHQVRPPAYGPPLSRFKPHIVSTDRKVEAKKCAKHAFSEVTKELFELKVPFCFPFFFSFQPGKKGRKGMEVCWWLDLQPVCFL